MYSADKSWTSPDVVNMICRIHWMVSSAKSRLSKLCLSVTCRVLSMLQAVFNACLRQHVCVLLTSNSLHLQRWPSHTQHCANHWWYADQEICSCVYLSALRNERLSTPSGMTENSLSVHVPSTQAEQAKGTSNKYTALEAVVSRASEEGNKEVELQLLLEFTKKSQSAVEHNHQGTKGVSYQDSNQMHIDSLL